MAKHKAPTQVTIASLQGETFFNQFVDRYWKHGVALALIAAVAILIPVYLRQRARETHHTTWDDLRSQTSLGDNLFSRDGSAETLAGFADKHKNTPVGGWAKALEVGSQLQAERLDEADKAAGQLSAEWPDHFLSQARLYPGPDGNPQRLGDSIREKKTALQAWEKEHSFLFSNPPLPADAPRVRINTNKGAIVVGLYVDRVPKHAENFLKLCRDGFYNGTKFHKVLRESLIQGGDPNTISGPPESWGSGGPTTTIEGEDDPQLRHFKGALVAWRAPGQTASHGSQFFLTTADQNQMDGQSVVFGRLLEGESVVQTIESGAVVDGQPQDPAVIESTEVL